MLLELRVENYAVIDRAAVEFGPGLNLLTGETGAGKSILIDALQTLLGGKASTDMIRHGSERAVLACVFELTPGASALLADNGIDVEDGEPVLLRREITLAGKGRVFINNQPATVAVLRQLAPELALVHSQNETTGAFDQAQQLLLLDRAAHLDPSPVTAAFRAWRSAAERVAELESSEQDLHRSLDLWRFQLGEIEEAGLSATDEDARLEAEKRVLANSERIFAAAMRAHDLLYEAEGSASASVGGALKQVEELARFDPAFREAAEQLRSALAAIDDVSDQVRAMTEKVEASPERLAAIEDRLAELDRLKRKYGSTLEEVAALGDELRGRLDAVDNREVLLAAAKGKLDAEAAAYRKAATVASAARTRAAKSLEKRAEAQINDLAMRTRFGIEVTPRSEPDHWTAAGWDGVEYRISTNPGEPEKPLTEIASGGEMSRVMLALKVTVEETAGRSRTTQNLPRTLVFDEIDIGIGGRAAEAVGRKLKTLAAAQQVLCITHLPQIAAFADQHFLIEKSEVRGRTQTSVRRMDTGERTREIARMLSGSELTETSLRHAEHLLTSSR